jgi:hypothetical protein
MVPSGGSENTMRLGASVALWRRALSLARLASVLACGVAYAEAPKLPSLLDALDHPEWGYPFGGGLEMDEVLGRPRSPYIRGYVVGS